jgi:hypothetical protein
MNTEQKIQRCQALVIALVGKANAELWWLTHNVYFNAMPVHVPVDEIYNYLMEHAAGDYQ